jgi:nucleotidyltransferase substrate binding protein (TIGR01987 family)
MIPEKKISIDPLLRAFEKFESFRMHDKTEQERAGIIQAFEYCFELSWKIMKKFLENRGVVANSPKEVFRHAAKEGFIDDPEKWFDFLKKRNLSVHTYNQDQADEVIAICPDFSKAVTAFIKQIKNTND